MAPSPANSADRCIAVARRLDRTVEPRCFLSRAVRRLSRAARGLGDDRRGAAAVEFAIVCLPFLGFVMLIFQVALYHFALQSLDYATRVASRQAMLGSVATSAQSMDGFRSALICPNFLMNFDCGGVVVNAYKVGTASDQATSTGIYQFVDSQAMSLRAVPSQTTFCLGGGGDYVFLDVSYTFPNFVGSLLSASGVVPKGFVLRSTNFFRNEPTPGKSSSC